MKKYGLRKRAAVLMFSTFAAMMILSGSVLADEAVVDAAATTQVTTAAAKEEIGPGVGAGYEELLRRSAERAAAKAAQKKQEIGPGMEVPGAADGSASDAGSKTTEQKPAGPGEVGPGVSGPGAETTQDAAGRVIDPAKPMVALTIDDGPYAPVGNRILDCLAEHGAKATFYMVGNRCSSYVEEMQRIAADGHELGNHTYSHKYLVNLGAEGIQREIQRGAEAIQTASGVAPATVRLPGGLKNSTVLANVHAPMIMWSIDTLDWKTKDAQSTVDAVLNKVKDGDIILIHELYQATADAVVQLVPALIERGYQLVTVSEIATYRGGLESGKVYYNFYPEQ